MDGEPLPPDATFHCDALACTLRVRVCLVRQAISRRQRTADTWRGQAATFPTCTATCIQGAEIRRAAGGASVAWRGAGAGGRSTRERSGRWHQAAARRRLQLVGLLDPVPTIDCHHDPCEDPVGFAVVDDSA